MAAALSKVQIESYNMASMAGLGEVASTKRASLVVHGHFV